MAERKSKRGQVASENDASAVFNLGRIEEAVGAKLEMTSADISSSYLGPFIYDRMAKREVALLFLQWKPHYRLRYL